jgi:TonB family protein
VGLYDKIKKQNYCHKMKLKILAVIVSIIYFSPAIAQTKEKENFTGEAIDISKVDKSPIAKFQARPDYPFEMRRSGTAGSVTVNFIVDIEGNVRNAHAVRYTQREFVSSALEAIKKWKFRPGMKDGVKVNTIMQTELKYELNEES